MKQLRYLQDVEWNSFKIREDLLLVADATTPPAVSQQRMAEMQDEQDGIRLRASSQLGAIAFRRKPSFPPTVRGLTPVYGAAFRFNLKSWLRSEILTKLKDRAPQPIGLKPPFIG